VHSYDVVERLLVQAELFYLFVRLTDTELASPAEFPGFTKGRTIIKLHSGLLFLVTLYLNKTREELVQEGMALVLLLALGSRALILV